MGTFIEIFLPFPSLSDSGSPHDLILDHDRVGAPTGGFVWVALFRPFDPLRLIMPTALSYLWPMLSWELFARSLACLLGKRMRKGACWFQVKLVIGGGNPKLDPKGKRTWHPPQPRSARGWRGPIMVLGLPTCTRKDGAVSRTERRVRAYQHRTMRGVHYSPARACAACTTVPPAVDGQKQS